MPEANEQPITRADLRAELDRLAETILRSTEQAVRESEDRSQEFARDRQTELLTTFHDYARG
jgi:hypothetical protein